MDPSRSGKSVELETLEECLPAIQNFLSGRAVDLRWFAGKLMKEGLIHRQAADSILNRLGTTNMERACGLMDAVVAQVEVDEEKYHRFCSILHDEGTLSGLDTMLKKAYDKAQPKPSDKGPSQREATGRAQPTPSDQGPSGHKATGGDQTESLGPDDLNNLYEFLKPAEPSWRAIGRQLEFSHTDFDDIVIKPGLHGVSDYFNELLSRWLKRASERTTVRILADALRSVGDERLANKLERDFIPVAQGKAQPTPSGQGPSQHEAIESHRSAEPPVKPNQQGQQAQLDKSGEDETDYKSPDEEPLYPETHKDEIDKEKEPYTDPLDTAKYEKIKEFAKDIKIIIQCCNKYEYFACLDRMEPPDSTMFNRSVRYPCATLHIVVGMFARRKAAIIWTKQGSKCDEELRKACDLFPNSKAIIGVGVCYGMNRKTVKFCDVIVSSQVVDCGDRPRLDKEGCHPRGAIINTGPTLENTFCKEDSKWVFCCVKNPKERKSKAIIGQIISAPFLLDSKEITENLMKNFKNAKGGEMEGWVLYTKGFSRRETIIIKGVADYADGEKNEKWQLTAAMAAADYTHYKLEKSPAFLYED